jgi:hypothetical protein
MFAIDIPFKISVVVAKFRTSFYEGFGEKGHSEQKKRI